jgi:hypothetical protein
MYFFTYKKLSLRLFGLALFALLSWSCRKEGPYKNLPVYGPRQPFYALTDQNAIVAYNARDVRTPQSNISLSGLAASETMLSIDFRPATGELYGISSLSRLYLIDVSSGAVRGVSATAFAPLLNGTIASMDFNPVDDRIRIVTNTGQNLRINPETGLVEGNDTNLSGTAISGIAYNNNYAGAATSILYDLDVVSNILYKQDPQNAATLVNIGSLGLTLGNNVSFDISPDNLNALAVGKLQDSTKLFTIDLSTGKATLSGKFSQNVNIRGIAMPTNPVAYAIDNTNQLVIFNPSISKPIFYNKPISGLQAGETIYGIDMRPFNGQLYAIGSSNHLYTVHMGTGKLTAIGTLSTALSGTSFGFDFNPVTDIIRVVSNTGQNLRISPTTAAVTIDPSITPTSANLTASAFTNNFRTSSATILYVIDDVTDKLYKQEPNTGVLTEVGGLKVDITSANGFDILYSSGDVAYGVFTVGATTNLYTINLTTGEATAKVELARPISAFAMGLRFN